MDKYVTSHGYIRVKTENGWVYEHRYVMEQAIGRKLASNEIVHHKNGDKTDNRLENLRLYTNCADHFLEHGAIAHICLTCGKEFAIARSSDHKGMYCSRECYYESLRGKPFLGSPMRHRPGDSIAKKWAQENQGKHFCQCGCGQPIPITKEHHKPSVGISKYIRGHSLRATSNFREELRWRISAKPKAEPLPGLK